MKVTFTPFHAEHLAALTPCESQAGEYARVTSSVGRALADGSVALTAWAGVRCIGVGGLFLVWAGRAEVWAIFGENAGPHSLAVVRKIRDMMATYPSRRIDMTVKGDNTAGHRIAKLLGFGEPEARLEAYHPDGSDMLMYAKVQRWQQ